MTLELDEQTVPAQVRVRLYALVERAVSEGIAYGYRRAHKHVDDPTEATIKAEILEGVMHALTEVIAFEAL
jgi:hypothetical protein